LQDKKFEEIRKTNLKEIKDSNQILVNEVKESNNNLMKKFNE